MDFCHSSVHVSDFWSERPDLRCDVIVVGASREPPCALKSGLTMFSVVLMIVASIDFEVTRFCCARNYPSLLTKV